MAIPYATLQAGELVSRTTPLSWIVEGIFLEAGAGILGGAPKSCKSFFALDLCVAIASDTACAGRFRVLTPGPVVILCAEDPPAVISSRLSALARTRNRSLKDLPIEVIVEPAVRLPEGIDRLEATLAAFSPRLLLLDPLIRLHRADENSASEMSVILDGLRKLARSSKTSILLVHHARKAAAGSAGTGLRGSSDLHAFGDSNLYLRRLSQDSLLELKVEHRAAAAPAPLRLKLIVDEQADPSARFEVLDAARDDDPTARRILDLLAKSDAPLSSSALRGKLGIRNQTVAEALKLLQANGCIKRVGRDGWSCSDA
jgi:biotin operon repressor